MEQIIRQIINHIGMQIYETTEVFTVEHASKKTTELITMFIDWLAKEVTLKLIWKDGIGYVKRWHYSPYKWNFEADREWSLDELFKHWINNVSEIKPDNDPNEKYKCTCDKGQTNWRDCPLHGGH